MVWTRPKSRRIANNVHLKEAKYTISVPQAGSTTVKQNATESNVCASRP